MAEINTQYFSLKTQKDKDYFRRFLMVLLERNDSDYRNEIRLLPVDCDRIKVDWTTNYREDDTGFFCYVDEDEVICKRVRFPDDHYEYMPEDLVNGGLNKWHEEHPEWIKTDYGTWTNVNQNRPFMIEYLMKDWLEHKNCPTTVNLDYTEYLNSTIEPDALSRYYSTVVHSILQKAAAESVLLRTDFIVVDSIVLGRIFEYCDDLEGSDRLIYDDAISLLGTIEHGTNTVAVYIDRRIPVEIMSDNSENHGRILFMTDSGYVIGDMSVTLKYGSVNDD